jgi:hypothetical protein
MNDFKLREVKNKKNEVPLGSDCSLHKNVFLKWFMDSNADAGPF